MDNTLLKYSAKDHFFKAVLCHLCVDLLNGQLACNKYKDLHPAFTDSRECKFLEVGPSCLVCYSSAALSHIPDIVRQVYVCYVLPCC